MKVGVLITNFHAWSLTERAIREVLRWSGDNISQIMVVDDASDAPEKFPESDKVVIHRNPENLGYVRSVNVGIRLLTDEVVVFLDCDAYPLIDLVLPLIRHFEAAPQLGALGFYEQGAGGMTRIAGDCEPTLINFLLGQALGTCCARRGLFEGRRFVLHSCCMAVRRAAFVHIGGFDEAYDFLDADTDFSMRLLDAGWLIKKDKALKCFHQGSGSPQSTSRRVVRFHRNRWLLLQKHGKVRSPSLCRFLLILRHLSEWTLLTIAKLLRLQPANQMEARLSGRVQLLHTVARDYNDTVNPASPLT